MGKQQIEQVKIAKRKLDLNQGCPTEHKEKDKRLFLKFIFNRAASI